jgi:hypothetical protein
LPLLLAALLSLLEVGQPLMPVSRTRVLVAFVAFNASPLAEVVDVMTAPAGGRVSSSCMEDSLDGERLPPLGISSGDAKDLASSLRHSLLSTLAGYIRVQASTYPYLPPRLLFAAGFHGRSTAGAVLRRKHAEVRHCRECFDQFAPASDRNL